MSNVPFPITATDISGLQTQIYDVLRDLYEERIGGLDIGDVFSGSTDVLALNIDSSGGLEKSLNNLKVKIDDDGGLRSTSDGLGVLCKAFGGLGTDTGGLYIVGAVTKGFREGLNVTIKDTTNLYVSGGAVEIAGANYSVDAQLTIPIGTVSANTTYYVYVDAPATGTTLAIGDFTLSTTAPTFNHSLGAYYKTGDNTKRYVARYYQVGGTISAAPAVGADDGYGFTSDYSFYAVGSDPVYCNIVMGQNTIAFIRFPNVLITHGDIITSAVLTFKASSSGSASTKLLVYGNDVDNATAPTTYGGLTALVKTTASAAWVPAAWTENNIYTSSDVKDPIQEVIDRAGWTIGNALQLIFSDNGSAGWRKAVSYDLGAAPSLAIVINAIGVTNLSEPRNIEVGYGSGNVPNNNDILYYDATNAIYKPTNAPTFDHIHTDKIEEVTADHGIDADGWHIKDGGTDGTLTGAANTFNITKGTASLDVAAGATLNIDASLTVSTASTLTTELHVTAPATHIADAATGFTIAGGTTSKTLAVENTSAINQDVTSDAQPTFAQLAGLGAPDANGEAIRATTKITEVNLESAVDLKHAAVTLATDHGLSLSTQQLAMGTPSTLTAATTNAVTTTTHTHAITGFSETSHNHNLSGLTSHNHSDLDNIGANDHHNAVTVSAPIAKDSGQALSLVNNAMTPAQVTAIDVGTLATTLDTVVPTSKAVYTYAGTAVSKAHDRSHALDSTSDHSIGSLTNTYLVKNDGSKLVNATNTDAEVASAVTYAHQPIYWQILAGETITVGARQQYAVFSRLDLRGTISLAAGAELAIHT
jgi:hypothetical protein